LGGISNILMIEIGEHRLLAGDILNGVVDDVMLGEKADLLYSDPPWGQGNLQFWRTMNSKMNDGVDRVVPSWSEFLKAFSVILNNNVKEDAHVIISMGIKWGGELSRFISNETGLVELEKFTIYYRGSGKLLPCLFVHYHRDLNGRRHPSPEILDGTFGYDSAFKMVSPFCVKGRTILDPCTGLGQSARLAHDTGMVFRGTELNETRLDSAAKLLKGKCSV